MKCRFSGCGKEFRQFRSTDRFCSFKCAREAENHGKSKKESIGAGYKERIARIDPRNGEGDVRPKRYKINKAPSKKQAQINAQLAEIKKELVHVQGQKCSSCLSYGPVDLSHLIPKSLRRDLILDERNLVLHCRRCHDYWEHRKIEAIKRFLNLAEILERMKELDEGRYLRLVEKLNKQK